MAGSGIPLVASALIMPEPFKPTRIPSLKTVADFRRHLASLGLDLPCEETIAIGADSPLAQPVTQIRINGKLIGNRWAVQPMEGWDATTTGGATDEVRRRWQRFGQSGAKTIYGGEAMAVRPDGRANPNQLLIDERTKSDLAELRQILVGAHRERYGNTDDLVIGFQLTHSGRFCRPADKKCLEPRVAYRHPILDPKFNVTRAAQVLTDAEIDRLVQHYVTAARVAWDVGADFVDIKHCHGYLLHEFLSAFTRPGKYGGSFENRTRPLREIVQGIRASGNPIDLGVRLSAFDFVPFKPDPALSLPGKPGPGIPEDFSSCLPYCYAFGVNPNNPVEPDLTETFQFIELCAHLGVKLLNLSAGSPYYTPHIQRPAAYPPSDGYQPAHDPLIDVARQIHVVRQVKRRVGQLAPASGLPPDGRPLPLPGSETDGQEALPTPLLIGSAYSYLQEYLPHVAQYVVRHGWTDLVGLGRMTLSYPNILADAVEKGALAPKFICRTFSDCTTAPRNGLISGCYPLDRYYSTKPEFQQLKQMKKAAGEGEAPAEP
ncbi:MAG TPA: NADH:flavin oxidoreductase [Candidatus Binatia bacterium]|nr:NADH:flavin oxidoreductase [Candidatus Binatia bacterium]